jgi:hypothetical protein
MNQMVDPCGGGRMCPKRRNRRAFPARPVTALALVLSALSPAAATAQNGSGPSMGEAPTRLAWFVPLIGGSWQAEGEVPGAGAYTAERQYAWSLDSTYVRVTQTMHFESGPSIEEHAMMGWDPVDQRIHVWSFASDGSYSDGYEVAGQDPRRWTAEGRTFGGRGGEWRITTFIYDANAFSVLIEVRSGRVFESALTMAFRRRD